MSYYAPGMRILISAEWIVRWVDTSSDGGQQLRCSGVSELVRDKDVIFLSKLEDDIQILNPEETILVTDDSSGYSNSLPKRLGDLKGEYFSTVMFDETYAQRDGTIKRKTCFPESAKQWVMSGPHFFVGDPYFKTSREACNTNKAYDNLDLINLPDD